MTDLSAYPISVGTELYVFLDIPNNPLRFSDSDRPRTVDSENYASLGSLLGVGASVSSIRATRSSMTISVNGIPSENLSGALSDDVKGSKVQIRRGYVNPTTGVLIDTPVLKFTGKIDSVAFRETFSTGNSTFQIVFNAISDLNRLQNLVSGRKTNNSSEQSYFPNDTAFSRVARIRNTNFNFGSPNPHPTFGTTR